MQPGPLYLELAEHYDQRGEAQSRDRFLVLAADAALAAGDVNEAEHLRQRLLSVNPHHLLKPFKSFEEALKSRDVSDYISALRRRHPADQIAGLVASTVRPAADAARNPAPGPHLHVPPAQPTRAEAAAEHRPVEVYRLRPTEEPAPTSIKPRPVPPPPPLPTPPAKPARLRAAPEPKSLPHSLPPLPLPPEPSRARASSPFRPQPIPLAQPSTPVYQGIRMAATPGAWLCSVLFFVLLVGGVGLTVYSLGRVFLPAEVFNLNFIPNRE